jgi:hypothetical protein
MPTGSIHSSPVSGREKALRGGAAADLVHDRTRAPLPSREPLEDGDLAADGAVPLVGESADGLGELRVDPSADANLVH